MFAKSNQKDLFITSAAVLAIITAIYFRLATQNLDQATTQQPTATIQELVSSVIQHQIDLTQETPWAEGKTAVLIYSEEIGSVDGPSGRSFPTIKIWHKSGSGPHEELATVGKVGEYPNKVTLSQDKKSLLINLESKLQLLDLETKELRDIFVPKKSTYLNPVFSQDGKELFIWDQFYAEQDTEYFVHRLNLETLTSTLITSGDNGSVFGPVVWRDDNKVVMYEPLGEFARSWYFDLDTNQIIATPKSNSSGFVSNNGKSMSIVSDWVDDICNEFSGSAWSGYKIIDPVSGVIQGRLKQQWRPAGISAFSPEGKEIVYSVGHNITSREECEARPKPPTYYQSNFDGSKRKELTYSQFMKLVDKWGYDTIGATWEHDFKNSDSTITINAKPVVSSKEDLQIIAQYLK